MVIIRYFDLLIDGKVILSFASNDQEDPRGKAGECYRIATGKRIPSGHEIIQTAPKRSRVV